MKGWFQPRSPIDWIVLGVLIGSAAWWSHMLRADIPVIKIIGG
jgi:hypothetical protein